MSTNKPTWDQAPAWATHLLLDGFGQWHFVEAQDGQQHYAAFLTYPEISSVFTGCNHVFGTLEAKPV